MRDLRVVLQGALAVLPEIYSRLYGTTGSTRAAVVTALDVGRELEERFGELVEAEGKLEAADPAPQSRVPDQPAPAPEGALKPATTGTTTTAADTPPAATGP